MSTWFREITVIDVENLPTDRGAIIVSWHPGGLFDNLLTRGLLPGEQVRFNGVLKSDEQLDSIAHQVSVGKNVIVFPEGESHNSPKAKEIQDSAARIAMRAAELSEKNKPVIIPVGIHYSRNHLFRERVALTVERPIEISGTIGELTDIISGEITRSALSKDDWSDRELIWNARSIIHAERKRKNPHIADFSSYGEGVLGARRVRAAWEWYAKNEQKKCEDLESRTRNHMSMLKTLDLKPHHVDKRPKSVTLRGFLNSIFLWLFAWSFMLGFVTFSAIVGSFPPFLLVVAIDRTIGPRMRETSRGALKLYTALIVYPIWWLLSAYAFTWALLSDSSPIAGLADYSMIIDFLFSLPPALVLPLMIWWMPTAGKLQIKLYSKGKSSWRRMRLWARWRDSSLDWNKLCNSQQMLAQDLVSIGDGLILPGDEDWREPLPGKEDYTMVSLR